jgi:hypothetical protein
MIIKKLLVPKPSFPEAGLGAFFGGSKDAISSGADTLSKYTLIFNNLSNGGVLQKVMEKIGLVKKQ